MSTIKIQTRGKKDEKIFDSGEVDTIGDIKKQINGSDPSSVLLTYKDKLLIDSTKISTLDENCTLILENDIEFSDIYGHRSKTFKATVNEKPLSVGKEDVFFKDGKSFLITKRKKKIKLSEIWAYLYNNITKAHIIQVLFLAFIFSSKNYPLISIILFINLLKFVSQMLLRLKIWEGLRNDVSYAVFMFFASFIAIDHNKFLKKTKPQ